MNNRVTKANVLSRIDALHRYTGRRFEYQNRGYCHVLYCEATGSHDDNTHVRSVEIRGTTKRELIDNTHTFMQGFWMLEEMHTAAGCEVKVKPLYTVNGE